MDKYQYHNGNITIKGMSHDSRLYMYKDRK